MAKSSRRVTVTDPLNVIIACARHGVKPARVIRQCCETGLGIVELAGRTTAGFGPALRGVRIHCTVRYLELTRPMTNPLPPLALEVSLHYPLVVSLHYPLEVSLHYPSEVSL